MEILNEKIAGNTVQDWLAAVAVSLVVFAALQVARRVLLHRLEALSKRTESRLDDLLVEVLGQTRSFFVVTLALFAGEGLVLLSPAVTGVVKHATTVAVIAQIGFWGSCAIRFWLGVVIEQRASEDRAAATTLSVLGFIARVVLWVGVSLAVLQNLGIDITAMVAGLGIGGVAVALAVQNVLSDLFASLVIVLDKPFVIGDVITVDTLSGTVEKIGLKTTRIRAKGGEQLIFSHSDLLKSRIRNFHRMEERRIAFRIAFKRRTPLDRVEAVPTIASECFADIEGVRFDRAHLEGFAEAAIVFQIVYFVLSPEPAAHKDAQERVALALLRRFTAEGLIFVAGKKPEEE